MRKMTALEGKYVRFFFLCLEGRSVLYHPRFRNTDAAGGKKIALSMVFEIFVLSYFILIVDEKMNSDCLIKEMAEKFGLFVFL